MSNLFRFTAATLLAITLVGCGTDQGRDFPSANPAATTVTSFVDPTATVAGSVNLGPRVYVAPFARISAGQSQLSIGAESDIQDNALVEADAGREVFLGDQVILAHGCSVVGPARLGATAGKPCFVGFNARVEGAQVEADAMVQARSRIGPGLILHSGKKILPGRNVTTQAEADDPALGKVALVDDNDRLFMRGVLDVNLDLAKGYVALQSQDPSAIRGIGPSPQTALNPTANVPVLVGQQFRDPAFGNRIIGQIFLDDPANILRTLLGQRTSIRADEGGPFVIGLANRMDGEVTVHALEHSEIDIGHDCHFGFHCVIHGGEDVGNLPHDVTVIGSNVQVGDRAVLFRSNVGDNCVIGNDALVDGCQLPPNTVIPPRTIMIRNVIQGSVNW